MNKNAPRLIAHYLPQFHPIPDNDNWWGKGFTEWTNVTKSKPLFRGHYQPRLPSDLGFYDLRLPEVKEQQVALARSYGVHGFCYYHYWFGNGKKLLEGPIKAVLESGKPDFPFMFCWANHKWSSHWIGNDSPEVLIAQEYPGEKDIFNHFMYLLPFFKDNRYIRINGKVAFQIYKPYDIPDLDSLITKFQKLAKQNSIGEIYFIGGNCTDEQASRLTSLNGFTSNELGAIRHTSESRIFRNRTSVLGKTETKIRKLLGYQNFYNLKKPVILDYEKAIENLVVAKARNYDYFPTVVPDWDNSARAGKKALILKDSTPALWERHLRNAIAIVRKQPDSEKQILFIKSWNEWAEGNYLEPDAKWGHQYLEAIKKVLDEETV